MSQITGNAFDVLLILFILLGIRNGQRNGMSQEVLPLMQWLAVVVIAPLLYSFISPFLVRYAKLTPLMGSLVAYGSVALVVFAIFQSIKQAKQESLKGSDKFGKLEYPLGIVAAVGRYLCILLFILALLNAKRVDKEEEQARSAKLARDFGKMKVPSFATIQRAVFLDSYVGPYITFYLSNQLIARERPKKG